MRLSKILMLTVISIFTLSVLSACGKSEDTGKIVSAGNSSKEKQDLFVETEEDSTKEVESNQDTEQEDKEEKSVKIINNTNGIYGDWATTSGETFSFSKENNKFIRDINDAYGYMEGEFETDNKTSLKLIFREYRSENNDEGEMTKIILEEKELNYSVTLSEDGKKLTLVNKSNSKDKLELIPADIEVYDEVETTSMQTEVELNTEIELSDEEIQSLQQSTDTTDSNTDMTDTTDSNTDTTDTTDSNTDSTNTTDSNTDSTNTNSDKVEESTTQ